MLTLFQITSPVLSCPLGSEIHCDADAARYSEQWLRERRLIRGKGLTHLITRPGSGRAAAAATLTRHFGEGRTRVRTMSQAANETPRPNRDRRPAARQFVVARTRSDTVSG